MKKNQKKAKEMPKNEEFVLEEEAIEKPLDKLDEKDVMTLSNFLLQTSNIALQIENLKIKQELIEAKSAEFQMMLKQKYALEVGDQLDKDFSIIRASKEPENKA